MHDGGWTHNDLVNPFSNGIRNLLWTKAARPVFIDFVTASKHKCNGKCAELEMMKTVLRLSHHDIAIWAR